MVASTKNDELMFPFTGTITVTVTTNHGEQTYDVLEADPHGRRPTAADGRHRPEGDHRQRQVRRRHRHFAGDARQHQFDGGGRQAQHRRHGCRDDVVRRQYDGWVPQGHHRATGR